MRHSLNSGLTGSEILDFIVVGMALAAAARGVMSVLSGRMPGPGMIPAALGGAIVAAILFVFKDGMGY